MGRSFSGYVTPPCGCSNEHPLFFCVVDVQVDEISRRLGILSPSQQEFYTARKGDFRYDVPVTTAQLQSTAVGERASELPRSAVNDEYINALFRDYNTFLDDAMAAVGTLGFDDAAATLESYTQRGLDLQKRAAVVERFFHENRDTLGEETYKKYIGYLKDVVSGQKAVRDHLQALSNTVEDKLDELAHNDDVVKSAEHLLNQHNAWFAEGDTPDFADKRRLAMIEDSLSTLLKPYGITLEQFKGDDQYVVKAVDALRGVVNEQKIAYTTSDGKNVTWQQLYDTKKHDEELTQKISELKKNADWKTMSRYDPKYEGDNAYHYANYAPEDWEALGFGANAQSRLYMNDDEKAVFNYLWRTEGRQAAETWRDSFSEILETRRISAEMTEIGDMTAKNGWTAAGMSVLSVGSSLLSAVEYVGDALEYIVTGEMGTNEMSQMTNTIRSTVSDMVDWNIPALNDWDAFDFLYNTGMSAADSLATLPIGGWGSAAMLGLSAAASATNEALERGLDDQHAFWGGVAAGAFEMIFEKVSIGQFESMKDGITKGLKDAVKNLGKSMIVNMTEETATEIANILYDNLANGELSAYATAVRTKIAQGMSKEDAVRQASGELGVRIAEAAASGVLMGIGFGGVSSSISYANTAKIGNTLKANNTGNAVIDLGKTMEHGSQSYTLAMELDGKESVTDAELGELYILITEQAAADGLTADDLVTQVSESHESDYAAIVANAETALSDEGGGDLDAPSTPATTFKAPTVEELTAAFIEGAKRAGYVPSQTPATPANSQTDTPSTKTTSEESAKTTVTEPTVAELTAAFIEGAKRAGYIPPKTSTESTSTIPDTESNRTDMENTTESSTTDSGSSVYKNVHDLQYVFSSDRDTVTSFAKDTLGLEDVSAYSQMNIEVANGINEAIEKVSRDFGDIVRAGYLGNILVSNGELGSVARYDRYFKVIVFNHNVNRSDALTALTNDASFEYEKGGWSSPHPLHSVYHELGHAVYEMVVEQNPKVKDQIKRLYREVYNDIIGEGIKWNHQDIDILHYAQAAKRKGLSYYGLASPYEMVAEGIAQYCCSTSPSGLAKRIMTILKGE